MHGISISLLLGENGLINKAVNSSEEMSNKSEQEQILVAWSSLQIKTVEDKNFIIDNIALENELKNNGNDVKVEYVDNDFTKNFIVTFNKSKNKHEVDRSGKIVSSSSGSGTSEELPPVELASIKAWDYNSSTDFHNSSIRNNIKEIEFVDLRIKPAPGEVNGTTSWDVSQETNGTIIAWIEDIQNSEYKKLYIGGIGGVKANTNSAFIFYGFTNLESINFGRYYDTSEVLDMKYMFANSNNLQTLDLSSFNTTNVTDMSYMFLGAGYNWGSQSKMGLRSVNLSSFNTSNVVTFNSMFGNCPYLKELDLRNFNTSNATDMADMFNGPNDDSSQLEVIKFGEGWDTSKVTNMTNMFIDTASLRTIYAARDFDLSLVTSSSQIFDDSPNLTGGNGTKNSNSSVSYTKIDNAENKGLFTAYGTHDESNNTRVNYIDSTGSEYIDTLINASSDITLEVDGFTYTDCSLYGIRYYMNATGSDGNVRFYYYTNYGEKYDSNIATGSGQRHVFKQDKNILYVDGVLNHSFSEGTFTSNAHIYLFARSYGNSPNDSGAGRIYSVKIWDGDNLVRDYYASYNTVTETYGLYDEVSHKFFGNSGSGAFIHNT